MRGSGPGQIALRADVDDGRRHRAVGLDRLRIRLEVALRGDEVDQLLGDVDVRLFKRAGPDGADAARPGRSEEHTSELQSLMRSSYAVFCLKNKKQQTSTSNTTLPNPHST